MIIILEVPSELQAIYPHEPSLARAALAALSDPSAWTLPSVAAAELPASTKVKLYLPLALQPKPISALVDALARVMHAHNASKRTTAATESADSAYPLPLSALQKEMLEGTERGIANDKIVFAEGSTGMGKTRVICYAAATAAVAAAAANAIEPVVIAVPTVALITQVLDTWKKLETGITAAVLLGRGQFINVDMVSALLDEPGLELDADTIAAVRQWIANKGMQEDSLFGIPWLRDSLVAVAPDMPMLGLTHNRKGGDQRAETAYQMAQLAASKARVVITTHAMIASQVRTKSLNAGGTAAIAQIAQGAEPEIDQSAAEPASSYALFIDEAHQFAGAVESAFSDGLSLFALRYYLRALTKDEKVRARVVTCVDRMLTLIDVAIPSLVGLHMGQSVINLTDWSRKVTADVINGLSTEAAGLKRLDASLVDSIKRVADGLNKEKAPAILTFSPVKHLPTITAGPRNLNGPLTAFWKTVPRAALFSGTLYAPTQAGWSANWVRAELSIPDERKAVLPRFIEPWVFEPQLNLPSPKFAELFTPPSASNASGDTGSENAYFDAISSVIRDTIYPTARGGILVLCTSFGAINEITKRLGTIENLIAQKSGGFTRCRQLFRQLPKPVWIATGAAWTGLDLVAPTAPEDDFLLTDVVIARIPFRFAETPLAQARFQRLGQSAVRIDGSFKLRQGMGRLQRRKGCTERRLWILDGRVSSASKALTFLMAPIKTVLTDYKQTSFFEGTAI